jgi:uncharacterized protein (DUF302 family)
MSGSVPNRSEAAIVTKQSPWPVRETVARLVEIISDKGLTLFAVIDQREEARRVGLELRSTTLVIFGSPIAGTPVMDAVPLAAVDLPLKVVIWDNEGQTVVSYVAPDALAHRYGLSADLANSLAGIDDVTDALIAR